MVIYLAYASMHGGKQVKGYTSWSNAWLKRELNFLVSRGRPGSDEELGRCVEAVYGGHQRARGLPFIKKIHQLGPGDGQLAKKRVWASSKDQRMAWKRGAQWIIRVEGVHTLRKGFFKTT